jgi:cytochrome bd-type quinol oxidase subunit 2
LSGYRLNMKWSWLQNPAVALIALLASVIAIVQWLTSLCRYVYRLQKEAANERYRRVRIAAALSSAVVVIAISAITWPVLIAEAAKAGDHGFIGVLDVLEFAFLGLFAAQILLKEAQAKQRFSIFACALLFITLTTVATGYFFRNGSTAWIGTSIAPSGIDLGIITVAYQLLRRTRKIDQKHTDA